MIENLLAPFVPGFQNRYPGVEVHLLEAAATRLQSHVDRGDVQLGILPSGHDALLGELLYPIHVTVAVAQKHPFARRPTLEIVELADKPLLLLNRQFGLRSWFEATFKWPTLDHVCCWKAPLHTHLLHWRARGTGLRLFPLMCGSRGLMFVLSP